MKYSLKYPWKQKILESKKIELLLVALLLLAAIVIRAYHFGAPPIGVHQDEAMAAVDAKALADYGTDRYGMRLSGAFYSMGQQPDERITVILYDPVY